MEVRPGERQAQGEVGAHAVSYNLPPSTEEKESKRIALSIFLAWVNHKNHPFNMSPFVAIEGSRHPSVTSLLKQYARRWGEKSQTLQLYGGPKLFLLPLLYSGWWQRPFATNLLETFFFSQLELLKGGELLLPKSLSDTCWMGQAQLCSLHRFSSHCDPAWLPAIHMCYFPFVVMACGTWPENIINFRSGLTNNKPTVKREEVLGRPAVGWSRAVGTQCMQVPGGKERIIHKEEMH